MTVATVAGVVSLVALTVVVLVTLTGADRPEEPVAERFVADLFAGDAEAAYAVTAPDYRALVHPGDLAALAGVLRDLVGEGASVEVLGSERSGGAPPLSSLVGYRGSTAVGRVEGVVSVVQLRPDGPFLVRDVSYRFPEATDAQLAELSELTRRLNEAVADRAGAAVGGRGDGDG